MGVLGRILAWYRNLKIKRAAKDYPNPISLGTRISDEYINLRKRTIHAFWGEDKVFGRWELERIRQEVKSNTKLSDRERKKLLEKIDEYLVALEEMKTMNDRNEKMYQLLTVTKKKLKKLEKKRNQLIQSR